jgi:hypothetical protein
MSNTQKSNLPELLGGCMCGAIRYVLKGSPEVVYYCHCNDCKRSTGSAFHVGLVMRTDHVEIVGDTLNGYTKLSDSGNHMTRLFCYKCGSPLFTKDSAAPENIVIKAGSLDQPAEIQPSAQLWTIHAVYWARINPHIESLQKGAAYLLH